MTLPTFDVVKSHLDQGNAIHVTHKFGKWRVVKNNKQLGPRRVLTNTNGECGWKTIQSTSTKQHQATEQATANTKKIRNFKIAPSVDSDGFTTVPVRGKPLAPVNPEQFKARRKSLKKDKSGETTTINQNQRTITNTFKIIDDYKLKNDLVNSV